MLPKRLRFVLDPTVTIGNLLETSIPGREHDVFFTSDEDLSHYDLDASGVTGAALRDVVNKLCNITQDSGVMRFERVAIWKANSFDYFLWSLAVMRRGAISVPINGGMPIENMLRYINHCGTKTLITDAAGAKQLKAYGDLPDCLELILTTEGDPKIPQKTVTSIGRLFDAASIDYTPPPMSLDQHVMICHTSGTTGFPKGVLHGSDSFITAAKGQMKMQFVSRKNAMLCPVWMNHHISQAACLTTIAAGTCCHVVTRHDATHILERADALKPQLMLAFPDVYQRMCHVGFARYDLSSIRMWFSSGDAMHEKFIRELTDQGAFLRVFNKPVVGSLFMEFFGTSEIGFAALVKISERRTKQYARMVGRPSPTSPAVKIGDAEGRTLPAHTIGRMMIKGPTLFKGYWNNHDRGHDVIREDWWWSGDVGYRDHFGRFYQVDRDVDTVNTALGPVYGLPIEEEALKLDGVEEAVLLSRPAPCGSDEAVVLIQMHAGVQPDTDKMLADLKANCRWAEHVQAIIIQKEGEIPRGLTGKILKRTLREQLRVSASEMEQPQQPRPADAVAS